MDTPFVSVEEHRLLTQKVAARQMQAHDEAHEAVGKESGSHKWSQLYVRQGAALRLQCKKYEADMEQPSSYRAKR